MTVDMALNLSLGELAAITGLLLTILSAYVALRVKIQKIDTMSQVKFLELERKIAESNSERQAWVDDVKLMIKEFLVDNKEEHRGIMHDVKNIRQSIETIRVKMAEQRAVDRSEKYQQE